MALPPPPPAQLETAWVLTCRGRHGYSSHRRARHEQLWNDASSSVTQVWSIEVFKVFMPMLDFVFMPERFFFDWTERDAQNRLPRAPLAPRIDL